MNSKWKHYLSGKKKVSVRAIMRGQNPALMETRTIQNCIFVQFKKKKNLASIVYNVNLSIVVQDAVHLPVVWTEWQSPVLVKASVNLHINNQSSRPVQGSLSGGRWRSRPVYKRLNRWQVNPPKSTEEAIHLCSGGCFFGKGRVTRAAKKQKGRNRDKARVWRDKNQTLTLCRNSGKVCVVCARACGGWGCVFYRSEDMLQVRQEDKPQLQRHDDLSAWMW